MPFSFVAIASRISNQGGLGTKSEMIDRVFRVLQHDLALRRLGMAVVLQWKTIPKPIQDSIVDQAIAMGDHPDIEINAMLEELLGKRH